MTLMSAAADGAAKRPHARASAMARNARRCEVMIETIRVGPRRRKMRSVLFRSTGNDLPPFQIGYSDHEYEPHFGRPLFADLMLKQADLSHRRCGQYLTTGHGAIQTLTG